MARVIGGCGLTDWWVWLLLNKQTVMASKMFSPASSVLSSPEEEEDEEVLAVPENVRKQTQVLFYEYVDKRSHVDHGLSDQQASLLHESASSCIRKADIGGQVRVIEH